MQCKKYKVTFCGMKVKSVLCLLQRALLITGRQRSECSAKQGEKPYAYVYNLHKPQLSPLSDGAFSVASCNLMFC